MCGGRSSILHYGPLIEINKLYAPTPNGQSVAKQKQYPLLCSALENACHTRLALLQRSHSVQKSQVDKVRAESLKYMIVKAIWWTIYLHISPESNIAPP